jgi:hypothetical protein
MLRSALALLSMLQLGGRVRQSFDRLLWQASVIAVAGLLFILAVYRELASMYQPAEAATLMALALTLLGLLGTWVVAIIEVEARGRGLCLAG